MYKRQIYHGVLTSCNGFVYSMGAALLDLDEPWKVIARSRDYLLSPQVSYEQVGDVPNVVFPCAALLDGPTGRLTLYYGGADTVVCLAHGYQSNIPEELATGGPVRSLPDRPPRGLMLARVQLLSVPAASSSTEQSKVCLLYTSPSPRD